MADTGVPAHEIGQELDDIVRAETPFEEQVQDALALGVEYLGPDNGHLVRIDDATNHWAILASTGDGDSRYRVGA